MIEQFKQALFAPRDKTLKELNRVKVLTIALIVDLALSIAATFSHFFTESYMFASISAGFILLNTVSFILLKKKKTDLVAHMVLAIVWSTYTLHIVATGGLNSVFINAYITLSIFAILVTTLRTGFVYTMLSIAASVLIAVFAPYGIEIYASIEQTLLYRWFVYAVNLVAATIMLYWLFSSMRSAVMHLRLQEQSLAATNEALQKRKHTLEEDVQKRTAMLKKERDRAEQASLAKSEFLANMSHEIRTPLNAVIGMTSLLLNTPISEEQNEFVETIRSSGDSLLVIINDILDFSKMEAGSLELEEQPFDLSTCIKEALDFVGALAKEKNLELIYLIDQEVPNYIIGDVTRLRQILVNLLSNATKFTYEGEIFVSVNRRPRAGDGIGIHFSVQDTGIGIPEDRMDKLFRSFSQIDASTTREYGGTGLGLAISKKLTEMMGGTMWAESTEEVGTTMHFTICAYEAEISKEYEVMHRRPALDDKVSLIIDDNATNRRILTLQAESWGMRPIAVSSGQEALNWLENNQPDIVITDMQMPVMDGVALTSTIRKKYESSTLPIVMLTSIGVRPEGVKNLNFAAYLTKPVQPSRLHDTLTEIFEKKWPARYTSEKPVVTLDITFARQYPLRMLLAEDNAVNQKVAERILQKLGYRVDIVANGIEAVEACTRQNYDVVFMDIQMPEMDGVEATRSIRQNIQQVQQPYIIAMTANALVGDREKYLKSGMDDYVSKPIRIDELIASLERCATTVSTQFMANPEK